MQTKLPLPDTVLRSDTVQRATSDHVEFVFEPLQYVEPVKLGVCQLRQASVKLPPVPQNQLPR